MDVHVSAIDRQRHELPRLGVVDFDRAAEAPRELRGHERVDLPRIDPARKTSGDEQRHPFRRNARPLELVDGHRDCGGTRFHRCCGNRLRRRLDHERRAPAARDERLERLARERKPQRVAHGGGDVRDGLARRRRSEHDGVVVGADDRDPRPGEQRDSRQGSAR